MKCLYYVLQFDSEICQMVRYKRHFVCLNRCEMNLERLKKAEEAGQNEMANAKEPEITEK